MKKTIKEPQPHRVMWILNRWRQDELYPQSSESSSRFSNALAETTPCVSLRKVSCVNGPSGQIPVPHSPTQLLFWVHRLVREDIKCSRTYKVVKGASASVAYKSRRSLEMSTKGKWLPDISFWWCSSLYSNIKQLESVHFLSNSRKTLELYFPVSTYKLPPGGTLPVRCNYLLYFGQQPETINLGEAAAASCCSRPLQWGSDTANYIPLVTTILTNPIIKMFLCRCICKTSPKHKWNLTTIKENECFLCEKTNFSRENYAYRLLCTQPVCGTDLQWIWGWLRFKKWKHPQKKKKVCLAWFYWDISVLGKDARTEVMLRSLEKAMNRNA